MNSVVDPFYDIVVVGAGPAGSTLARFAVEKGLRVLLIDKRQELGAPIQCSGAVSRHALEENEVYISDEFIHEPIYGFKIFNGAGDFTNIDYRLLKPEEYGENESQKPLGYVVDRRRFDRYLLAEAEKSGAQVLLKAEGIDMESDGNQATIHIKHYNQDYYVKTLVVAGCDGLQSQVGKWSGLSTHIKLTELASCLQFIVSDVESEGLLEIITGSEWAPGGYSWVFPKGQGYAEIGLGVIRTMTDQNAQWHLDNFIHNSFLSERFKNGKILEVQGGGVPLAAPLKTQYANNVILVGDAARQVNPITGGGIHTALSGGRIAGNFLGELLNNKIKPHAENLKGYQDKWLKELGDKMWKLYREKTKIFSGKNIQKQDQELYATMSNYFGPDSEYKKI